MNMRKFIIVPIAAALAALTACNNNTSSNSSESSSADAASSNDASAVSETSEITDATGNGNTSILTDDNGNAAEFELIPLIDLDVVKYDYKPFAEEVKGYGTSNAVNSFLSELDNEKISELYWKARGIIEYFDNAALVAQDRDVYLIVNEHFYMKTRIKYDDFYNSICQVFDKSVVSRMLSESFPILVIP